MGLRKTAQAMDPDDKKRVLACFPERHIARLVEVSLKRDGHDVHCVYSVEELLELLGCLEVLELTTFTHIFFDHNLAVETEASVMHEIRSHVLTQGAKFVALPSPCNPRNYLD